MIDLAIDASAATSGGGVSRVRELARTIGHLAPHADVLFTVRPQMLTTDVHLPPRSLLLPVPNAFSSTIPRSAWQHLWLPFALTRYKPNWLFSPFGVLPMTAARLLSRTQKAMIVSNIAPFVAELKGAYRGQEGGRRLLLLRQLIYRSIAMADIVFLLSRVAHNLLNNQLEGKEVVFLPMAPPHPTILRQAAIHHPSTAPDAPFFLIAADLLRFKGVEDAIRAMLALEKKNVSTQLLVCGYPLEKDYVQELHRLAGRSLRSSIRFLGPLPQIDLLAMMRRATAVLVCSRVENVSRVPVEAMAMGAPIIAADVPISRETCGEAARYYEPGDVDQLAAVMERLINDESSRTTLADLSKCRVGDRAWYGATEKILHALQLS